MFIFFGLASIGLPGLNNFVGEILVLLGTFNVRPLFAAVAALAMVLSAVYILVAIQRVFFGKGPLAGLPSRKGPGNEVLLAVPLAVLVLLLGVYPNFAISKMGTSVANFIALSKRSIKEESKQRLDIIIPEIYQRGIEIILPKEGPLLEGKEESKGEETIPEMEFRERMEELNKQMIEGPGEEENPEEEDEPEGTKEEGGEYLEQYGL